MKKLFILILFFLSLGLMAQETPPVGTDFKSLPTWSFKFNQPTRDVWIYKGSTYGWTNLTRGRDSLQYFRRLNNHDSLNTLQEKNYSSLDGKPDLTVYRKQNNHDSLSTLQEKSYNSLDDKPTIIPYPGAGIPLSTGSAWGTSITNNSTNWNTAYSWGNHASAGYAPLASPSFSTAVYMGANPLYFTSSGDESKDHYKLQQVGWDVGLDYRHYTAHRFFVGAYSTEAPVLILQNGASLPHIMKGTEFRRDHNADYTVLSSYRSNVRSWQIDDISQDFLIYDGTAYSFKIAHDAGTITTKGHIIDGVAGGANTYLQFQNNTSEMGLLGSRASIDAGSATELGLYVYGNNPLGLWTNNVKRVHIAGNGTVGIGTVTTPAPLTVQSSTGANGIQINGRTDGLGYLQFYRNDGTTLEGSVYGHPNGIYLTDVNGSNRLFISTSGVEVTGTVTATGGNSTQWNSTYNGYSYANYTSFEGKPHFNQWYNKASGPTADNYHVGADFPLMGDNNYGAQMAFTTTTGFAAYIRQRSGGAFGSWYKLWSASDFSATDVSNWGTAYTHSQDNTQAHSDYLLNNASDATSGTLTATNFILSSDRRLKENIHKILYPTRYRDIQFVSFNLKKEPGQIRYGVIAQDVEKIAPELVRTDSIGMKSVAYIDLLIVKILDLENRVKELEANQIKKHRRHEK